MKCQKEQKVLMAVHDPVHTRVHCGGNCQSVQVPVVRVVCGADLNVLCLFLTLLLDHVLRLLLTVKTSGSYVSA